MWIFDIKTKEWTLLESKDTPDVIHHKYSHEEVIRW